MTWLATGLERFDKRPSHEVEGTNKSPHHWAMTFPRGCHEKSARGASGRPLWRRGAPAEETQRLFMGQRLCKLMRRGQLNHSQPGDLLKSSKRPKVFYMTLKGRNATSHVAKWSICLLAGTDTGGSLVAEETALRLDGSSQRGAD